MTSVGDVETPRTDADAPVRHSIWRPRGPVGDAARRSLRLRRATATILLVALAALFYVILATPFEHPQVWVAALTTLPAETESTYVHAATEPVPFVARDLEAWRQIAAELSPGHDAHPLLARTTPYVAADLEALGAKLDSLATGENDVLLLYVRSQGISRNGEPALLCRSAAEGAVDEVYPLSRLLTQLRSRPQKTKVLILDAGGEAIDFDSGTPVNEFPRQVAEAVAETHDARLWVLLSHGTLESSQVYWSRERSVLVDAIAAALSGAADANADDVIDLDELFRHVSVSVEQATVQISNGQATQTPELRWGGGQRPVGVAGPVIAPVAKAWPVADVTNPGQGEKSADAKPEAANGQKPAPANPFAGLSAISPVTVTPPSVSSASVTALSISLPSATTALPSVSTLASAALTTASQPPSEPATAAAGAPAPAPTPGDGPAPTAATEPPGSTGAPPAAAAADAKTAAKPDPKAEIAKLLIRLWELRDSLERRGTGLLTPIDTAPLEWRRLIGEIEAFELQYRAGAISHPELTVLDLRELVAALTHVAERTPRDSRPDPRIDTWLRIEANSALPALPVDSIALASALAGRGGAALSAPRAGALAQLNAALLSPDRRVFDEWLKALPPEVSSDVEFSLAADLSAIADLPWPLLRDAMSVRVAAERAAASWEPTPMVRNPVATGDELRLAAEQMLIDGVVADRMHRAATLLQQARAQYDVAEANAALLRRAREVWHDLSFQAPDYVRWCTHTGLATYRCGPAADDIKAMLAGLLELGRRLQSASFDDRDAIEVQVGLLEQLVARIDVAECARQAAARKRVSAALETPWQIQSLLTTSLPTAEHRLHLLQALSEIESTRLNATAEVGHGAPAPARTMSPRDWAFLQTCTGFHVELARLSVVGIPEGNTVLSRLTREWSEAQSRQSAVVDAIGGDSDDDLFEVYRHLGSEFVRFRSDLAAHVEQAVSRLNDEVDADSLESELANYEAILQVQRLAPVSTSQRLPAQPLLKLQLASLLAWEADRARSATVNTDPARSERYREIAARLSTMSGSILGSDELALETAPGLSIAAPPLADLSGSEQTIEVTVDGRFENDNRVWVVLEYDPGLVHVEGPPGLSLYREGELEARYTRGVAGQATAGAPLPAADGSFNGSWWTSRITSDLPPTWTFSARQPMTFALRVRQVQPATRPVRLIIKAVTAQQYARRLVEFRTPAPAFADLRVEGAAGAFDHDEHGIVFHPYPNRETDYRFQLVNLLIASRVVDVRLLALAAPLDFDLPVGTLSPAESATVFERLRGAVAVAQLREVPLPSPGAVTGGTPPAEPPPEEDNKKPLPSLRHGGVIAIVDHATQEAVFVAVRVEPQRPSRYLRPTVSYDLERERVEILVRGESADVMPKGGSSVRAEFVEPLDEAATFQLDGLLQAPGFETRLFADVPSQSGKVVHLRLHVDGYPRAFLYAIACDQDSTTVPLTLDALRVAVHKPDAGAAFRTPANGVPVRFELDAPIGAFDSLPTIAEIGLDLNRDRFLVNEPVVRLHGDRDVDVRLKAFKPTGSMTLVTKVDDFQLEIPITGLGTTSANVLGRIQVGGDVAWSEPREIMLDGDAPRIESIELGPSRELASDQKLRVAVRADDRTQSGTARVEMAFDLQRNGMFAPDAKIIAAAEVGSAWFAEVPLEELAPGTYGLLVRAVDGVGNASEPQREIVTILSKDAAAAKMLRATAPIAGVALYGEMPVSGASVVLHDDKEQVVAEGRSDKDGRFELPRVKPGTYKVKAQGLFKNKVRTAETEVVVPPPPKSAEAARLQLR